jgi:hypothetical protein
VPTSIEIDDIERSLEAPSAEIRALEAQLLQLQEQMDTKRTRRMNLSRSVAEHRNLLSPFRCLPDDILSEIFMACLPTNHDAVMSHLKPPLILGHVCRRWQSVAYRTPRLWASLHIAIPTPPIFRLRATQETKQRLTQIFCRNVNRHLSLMTIWLRRSKACPLSISLHDSYSSRSPSAFPPDFPARPYCNFMFTFSNRIRRLELDVRRPFMSDLLGVVPSTSFPHIQVLLLNFHRRFEYTPAEKWRNSRLLNVPDLTCLSMSLCPLLFQDMNIKWANLTHIVIGGSTAGKASILDAHKIFTGCPRLRFCNIDIECFLTTFETCTPFSLPYLHTLIIIDNSSCLEYLFEYAEIPSLRELSYHSKLCPSSEWCSALLAILAGTSGRVERLMTNIQFMTLVDLVECLEMTPSLTHLTNIHCISGYTSLQRKFRYSLPVTSKMLSILLDLLTPVPNRPTYLPQLQVVNFDSNGLHMKVSDWEILNFIRQRMDYASRTSQVAALNKVSFVLTSVKQLDLPAKLSDYVANGMKLHLAYVGG